LLFAASAFAQCRAGVPTRVSFERGKSTAVVNGELRVNGDACYSLRARAGQRMTISVNSVHEIARFNVFPPTKDHTIAHETNEWSGTLPETGDYVIALYTVKQAEGGSFTLEVSVTAAATPNATDAPRAAPTPSSDARTSLGNSSNSDANSQPYTFDAGEGAYVFDGKPPRGFEELTALELPGVLLKLSDDGASIVSVSTDPQALVDTKGGRQFKARHATINGDQITFETVAVRGVSYQFTGRFVKKQVDKGQLLDATLKGRLTKLVNGNKVAEAQLDLYEAVGG
jgi:hypothetical protein